MSLSRKHDVCRWFGYSVRADHLLAWLSVSRGDKITSSGTDAGSGSSQPSRNHNAFFEAFDIEEGDEMFLPPDERVVIW